MHGAVKLCSAIVNRVDSVHKTWTAFTQEKAITFAYILHIMPWKEFQNKEWIYQVPDNNIVLCILQQK